MNDLNALITYTVQMDEMYSGMLLNESTEYQWVIRTAYAAMRQCISDYKNDVIDKDEYYKRRGLGYIRKAISSSAYVKYLDASLIEMAVNEAKNKRDKERVIFGDTIAFEKMKKGDKSPETKEKWTDSRTYGIFLRGRASDKGNRKAVLDIDNSQIIIKIRKGSEIKIPINLSKKQMKILKIIQLKSTKKKAYFNIRINKNSLSISFRLSILTEPKVNRYVKGRVLAIDSNPNQMGIVIYDTKKNVILHEVIYEMSNLNVISGKNPVSTNKRHFEKCNIGKEIVKLAKSFHCEKIVTEDLSIKSKDNTKGINFNRMVNNIWNRGIFSQSLTKWANIYRIKLVKVYAGFSSFVGCLEHNNKPDSIAAAIEIAKRSAMCKFIYWKNVSLDTLDLPIAVGGITISMVRASNCNTVGELFEYFKSQRVGFRNLLNKRKKHSPYKSIKSKVDIY